MAKSIVAFIHRTINQVCTWIYRHRSSFFNLQIYIALPRLGIAFCQSKMLVWIYVVCNLIGCRYPTLPRLYMHMYTALTISHHLYWLPKRFHQQLSFYILFKQKYQRLLAQVLAANTRYTCIATAQHSFNPAADHRTERLHVYLTQRWEIHYLFRHLS